METSSMTDATPITTPSIVSAERSLFAERASNATSTVSMIVIRFFRLYHKRLFIPSCFHTFRGRYGVTCAFLLVRYGPLCRSCHSDVQVIFERRLNDCH